VLRVYLDEDVDVLLTQLLGARGFDCIAASHVGHLAWSDEQHLAWAQSEARVLITHNRLDFENQARQWWQAQRDHAGVILAMRRATSYELFRRLLSVLNLYDQSGWKNVVVYA